MYENTLQKVIIEFYENVNGHGRYTGKMDFVCITDGIRFMSLEKTSEDWIFPSES